MLIRSTLRHHAARHVALSCRVCLLGAALFAGQAVADTTPQTLPFSQDWTNVGLITADDNWSGVPGIEGRRGDSLTGSTGTNPQTILADETTVDVVANQPPAATSGTVGGVIEFELANPTVALAGSGTADAPFLLITLDTTGQANVNVAYNLRDVDGTADNTNQQFALQYRIGTSGNFTDVPAGYVADASSGPNLATLVTPVSAALPAAVDDQPVVQVRIITTNAGGNDEYVGIDDILITGTSSDIAPTLAGSDPADAETDVPVSDDIVLTFSEEVSVTGSWFTLECPTGAPIAAAVSPVQPQPATVFTLDPVIDLPNNTVCTVTVIASQVSDTDGTPTAMAADAAFSFTTITADPVLSIADVSLAEGSGNGSTAFDFTVTLNNAAAGAFTVDYTTAPGTATAPGDYAVTAGTLAFAGIDGETQTITVQVVGDDLAEADETFSVVLSNASDVDVVLGDDTAQATILNDDGLPFTPISQIQGDGPLSPMDGDVVTTRGIVTGIRSNGFFLQSGPAQDDGDPLTSEGIYVFAQSAGNMPPGLALGDELFVQGTVSEFSPPSDPNQLPLTELVGPLTFTPFTSGNPLPAPVLLPTPDANGAIDQLEPFEAMRVTVPSFTITAPTGNNATADESFGVVTGTPRPFREEGVDLLDCGPNLPDEAVEASVPCWDTNPELLRLKTNGLIGGAVLPLRAGTVLTGVTGVLDYAFRRYSIVTRAAAEPFVVVPGTGSIGAAASVPLPSEITIAGFNVENLSISSGNFAVKSAKIVETVADYMHYPDIIGFIEVASPETLTSVALEIAEYAASEGDPAVTYGTLMLADSGTQRLGFLIKTSAVAPGVGRVELIDIEQSGEDERVLCPDGVSFTEGLLNDRAPLIMNVVVHAENGAEYPVTVINNHLKSLIDVDSTADAGPEYACFNDPENPGGGEGRRNRAKRQQNAEYLTALVDDLQTANPGKPIVLVGDFNAFQFNDGYADLMNTILGTPTPDDATVVPDDGLDLVDPDLVNLTELVEDDERYSYVFEGNAQVLDHIVANQAVIDTTSAFRRETPRVNADFAAADGLDAGTPFRSSDHDPAIGYFDVVSFKTSDLVPSGSVDPTTAAVGDTLTYTYAVDNVGPDAAVNPVVTLTLPAGTGYASGSFEAGWDCSTPTVGSAGAVTCSNASLDDATTAAFEVTATLLPAAAGTTVTATVTAGSDSTDPTTPNLVNIDTVVDPLPVNTPPEFNPASYTFEVAAGAAPGTAVGTVTADDADGDTLDFSIQAGNTGGTFAITADGDISVADATLLVPGASFTLTVRAADADGAFDEASVDIDVPQAPAVPVFDPDSYVFEIDEDAANGTVVGQVSATHADGDTLEYAIDAGNTGNVFAIDPATGTITVADAAQLLVGSYVLEVSATDESGDTATAAVEVIVNDVPPAGTAIFADGFED